MDYLPVPPLGQTMTHYLSAVGPLQGSAERNLTEASVATTMAGEGPAFQDALERWADLENAQGRSWLSAVWLRGYLEVRTPLPLTSNVGFEIRVPARATTESGAPALSGFARAAAVVHRLAAVHLASLRGDLPAEKSSRGQDVCAVQRDVLAGGVRHPRADVDVVRAASQDPASREIGVLSNDRFFAVQISDETGQPLPIEALEQAIAAAHHAASEGSEGPGFTALSYLGSERASAYLERLLLDPINQRVYERLTQALLVINLIDVPADAQEHLRRTAFLPGQAWAYTSVTYQIGLADDFVGMHLEHSRVDAATLKDVLAQAQQDRWLAEPGHGEDSGVTMEALDWALPDDLFDDLTREITAYREEAELLRLDSVRLPRPVPADLPFRVSDDALCQWVMLYAQLATYVRVRSTYEAVDLRHFQAGRTECLRPNTPEAVALVQGLMAGTAQAGQLHAAAAAHKEWIKACKTGQGIDRHLTGLALMAAATDSSLPVQQDPAWERLKTDFLSTTSIGDHDQIAGMAFAPTTAGGLGINYTPLGEDYEFLVISHRTQTLDLDTFLAHLRAATQALAALLASSVTSPP